MTNQAARNLAKSAIDQSKKTGRMVTLDLDSSAGSVINFLATNCDSRDGGPDGDDFRGASWHVRVNA